MNCKFKKCCWNKDGKCVNKAAMIHIYDEDTIVKCNKYNKKGKNNKLNEFYLFNKK